MKKLIIAVFIAIGLYGAAAQGSAPPKELLQWVKDARQSGLADDQIRKNASVAGWPDAAVAEALSATAPDKSKEDGAKAGEAKLEENRTIEPATAEPAKEKPADTTPKVTPAQPTFEVPAKDASGGIPPATNAQPAAAIATPADGGIPNTGASNDYVIGAGDVLRIDVFHEPDASVASTVVLPDGKISMPLLKEVYVVGLSRRQLEKQITERLTKFLEAPDVTVIVAAINSKKVYVLGAVKKEGPLPLPVSMTVMQALSESGGLTDYAKRKKIYILHTENGKVFRYPFDYDAAIRGEHMELNIPLVSGDTVVVPH